MKPYLICVMLIATILSTSCTGIPASGTDAGCAAYGEARLTMPDPTGAPDDWLRWAALTDTRMTAVCR